MCGRYMITSSFEAMARLFEAEPRLELGANVIGDAARPNVSPTEADPGRRQRRRRPDDWWRCAGASCPPWYQTPNGGPLLINARAEGVATKPAFARGGARAALPDPGRRLLRVAGREGGEGALRRSARPAAGSSPSPASGRAGAARPTAPIVTCAANARLAPIHERMPVVLAPDDYALWLGEAGHGAARLMVPAPDEALVATPADAGTREHLLRPDQVAAVL